jgi:hypothetical protein
MIGSDKAKIGLDMDIVHETASATDRAHAPTRSLFRPPAVAKSAAAAFNLHEEGMTLTRLVFTQRAEIKYSTSLVTCQE